jgi:hypothetical protein
MSWIVLAVVAVVGGLVGRKLWRAARERAAEKRDLLEIRERAERARQQPPIADALGEFRCTGHLWQATVKRGENKVKIDNYDTSPDDLREALALHRAFIEKTLADDAPIRRAAAEKLLALYNDTWREGGQKIDVARMAEAFVLRRIHVSPDRSYGPSVFFFAPSWMFGGHYVHVLLEPNGDLKDAYPTDER